VSVAFEAATWYAATARDNNEACGNAGREFEVNPLYSNGGTPQVDCGLCGQPMEILAATLLEPQPEMP
jgi:hypothetical protein